MTNDTKPKQPIVSSKPTVSTRVTKKTELIKLLSTKAGSDIQSISAQLGWQAHTTRAALSGLRKAGFEITKAPPAKGGPCKYRIVPAAKGAQVALNDGA